MTRAPIHTCRAVVLRTYDVGEADRLAILLTDQVGRVAVRAAGVRRPGSRLMGVVQSFQLLSVRIVPWKAGWMLQGAQLLEAFPSVRRGMQGFLVACQGSELLLRLLQDHEPLPDVFAALLLYLRACADPPPFLFEAFALRVLTLLGLAASPLDEDWIAALRRLPGREGRELRRRCETSLADHGVTPLVSVATAPHCA